MPTQKELLACRLCPRLVDHREKIAENPRKSFSEWDYWGKPVPLFGDLAARIVFVGLAPAAHGANRTGRMFTGDRSGDFLFAALYRTGFANQPESTSRTDGLTLTDVAITAPVRCAPPANKPTKKEIDNCSPYLSADLKRLKKKKVFLCLGKIAHDSLLRYYNSLGFEFPLSRFPFAHGGHHTLPEGLQHLDSYHVSQQNTFTGRLTPAMFDSVLINARRLAETT